MRADVVVVGAGTAGAATAALCAERGLSVVCLEQRPLGEAGARWVNGVPAWCFDEAGFAGPEEPELRGAGHAFHLVCGWGPKRLVLRDHGVCEVDMRALVERLQTRAREAGARLVESARVTAFDGRRLETTAGAFEADWFVDASGLAGAGLASEPRVAKNDLCAAAQEVRRVRDPARARAFFEERGAAPGETLCFTSVAGGYSIVNVRLDDGDVSILTGSIPAHGQPSGRQLLDRFVQEQAWIGQAVFGGARAIPLRRPLARLGRGRVLLVGDAACQVFSAHGSGIGAGMVAARMLADTLAGGGSAHDYSVRWQRRWGGLFAGYDVFRRFSQTLTLAEVERLMDGGLLDETGARAGLAQRLPTLDVGAAKRALGLVRERSLGKRLLGVIARIGLAQALYARYPKDEARVDAWARRATRLLGA